MTIRRVLLFFILSLCLPTQAAKKDLSVTLNILGVAQDAGFPQVGCYEPRCIAAWENANLRQSATSLAVIDRRSKQTTLFEASPDLPSQLYQLHNRVDSKDYSLSGVFLTHAHIGHYTGLMYLGHEALGAKQVPVYVMPKMRRFLEQNGPWSQLVGFGNIELHELTAEETIAHAGISITPFQVPHRDEFSETVGYFIEGPEKRAVFIPDIDKWERWNRSLIELIRSVDYALLDATFFTDGELPNRDMSKVPHPLVTDTMEKLSELDRTQRNKVWFIHFNHTNPLLIEGSEATKRVTSAGFNVAREGVELPL